MTQALITQILGTVEISENGKKITVKKGSKISLETRIKTSSNAKVELEINGQTYIIHNDQDVIVKNILSVSGGSSDPTHAGGVRG